MSRGGRGGPGGSRKILPFEVDADLEDLHNYAADDDKDIPKKEDPSQMLFPPYPGGVPYAPPPTAREKKMVQIYREMQAAKHNSFLYTGPRTDGKIIGCFWPPEKPTGVKRPAAADFNAFEDQPTYGKKMKQEGKKIWEMDPKKYKWQAPELFPEELWETIGYDPNAKKDGEDGTVANGPKTRLVKVKDKLARFDDDEDAEGGAADDDDEEIEKDPEDEDDEPEVLHDDTYEEDEDDAGDDYNAEQYFDGGEDDYDEGGGAEEYGDEY